MKKLQYRQRKRVIVVDFNSLCELRDDKTATTDYRLQWFWKDGSTGGTVTKNLIDDILWLIDTRQLDRVKVQSLSI